MWLAIDIGNTHSVLGFFQKAKLATEFRITSSTPRTEDELWLIVQSFHSQLKQAPEEINGVVIASVVPLRGDYKKRTPGHTAAAGGFGSSNQFEIV